MFMYCSDQHINCIGTAGLVWKEWDAMVQSYLFIYYGFTHELLHFCKDIPCNYIIGKRQAVYFLKSCQTPNPNEDPKDQFSTHHLHHNFLMHISSMIYFKLFLFGINYENIQHVKRYTCTSWKLFIQTRHVQCLCLVPP